MPSLDRHQQVLTIGPFVGMNDTANLSAQDSKHAASLTNMYAPAATAGGDLISRPGFTRNAFTRTLSAACSVGGYRDTAGTFTFTNGSAAVTGSGTAFTTEIVVGESIVSATAGGTPHVVSAIADATHLTLTTTWSDSSGAQTDVQVSPSAGTTTQVRVTTADSIQLGDLLTVGAQTLAIVVRTSSTLFTASAAWSSGQYAATATVTQAGIVAGPVYGLWQHTLTTAVYHRLLIAKTTSTVIAGGGAGLYRLVGAASERLRLVEYDPSAAILALTDRTSASMDGVALDITARIYATTFANYFIVTDGTNRPRKIDSSWVLTNLTDANYAIYGPPTIYYGKLFFIDASDRITLRWSEENDPDTGYGTGTSDNSWSLRQTSSDQMECLIGTNEALYCFRQNSIAVITGAANSDFRSSGTIDAIQNIGTRSPDAVCVVNSSVVFLDQYGRPGRLEPGYGYVPLWKKLQNTLRGIGTTAALLRAAWVRYDPITNLVKFGYRASSSATTNDQMLVFDAETWECLGLHAAVSDSSRTAVDHAYSTVWLDENIKPRHTVAPGTTADLAFYIQKTEDNQVTSAVDTVASGAVTVLGAVETPKFGADVLKEFTFDRVVAGIRNIGGASTGFPTVTMQHRCSDATYGSAQAMSLSGSSGTYDGVCYKVERLGLSRGGRYIQAKFANDVTGNPSTRFTLDTVTLVAIPSDADYQRR